MRGSHISPFPWTASVSNIHLVQRYEAFIGKDWKMDGMTQVIVARSLNGNRIEVGAFLVDFWCLGVKDAFHAEMSETEWREFLQLRLPPEERQALAPTCARKFIEGAVAYAESIGFAPHRDFRKARRALSGVDKTACSEEFEYGQDGKPFFIAGPADDEARVDRILRVLEARCGPEGFH